jgi:hypothetical protein
MTTTKSLFRFVLLLISLVYAVHFAIFIGFAEQGSFSISVVLIDHALFIGVFLGSGFLMGLNNNSLDIADVVSKISENSQIYLRVMIFLCILGGILNVVDKYLIAELRPISCISEIRFAWLEVASTDGRSNFHAFLSFFGNALSSLLFPAIVILTINYQNLNLSSRRFNIGEFLVLVFLTVIYCGAFASRNLMFAFMAITFTTTLMFFYFHPNAKQFKKIIKTSMCILFIGMGFVFGLQNDRLNCLSNHDASDRDTLYINSFADEIPYLIEAPGKGCVACQLGAIYLSHGIANHSAMFKNDKIGNDYVFGFMASRLGLTSLVSHLKPLKFFHGGVTMVGAIKHDFSYIGIVVLGAICAFILKLILIGLCAVQNFVKIFSFTALIVYFYSISTSMMFFPIMTMPFLIMCFGFLFYCLLYFFENLVSRYMGSSN